MSSAVKAKVAPYLVSLREVNFIVYVIDRTYVTVDVNATIKVQEGQDVSTVVTAATQAVTAFLQPYAVD